MLSLFQSKVHDIRRQPAPRLQYNTTSGLGAQFECIALISPQLVRPPCLSFTSFFFVAIDERREYARPGVLPMHRNTAKNERWWLKSLKPWRSVHRVYAEPCPLPLLTPNTCTVRPDYLSHNTNCTRRGKQVLWSKAYEPKVLH